MSSATLHYTLLLMHVSDLTRLRTHVVHMNVRSDLRHAGGEKHQNLRCFTAW